MKMQLLGALAAIPLVLGTLSGTAMAEDYKFNVLYSGNGNATLADGSADLLSVELNDGDSFTYTLQATNGSWTFLTSNPIFPALALWVGPDSERLNAFTIELFSAGTNVFTYNDAAWAGNVHLGSNEVVFPEGLSFDTWSLTSSLVFGSDGTFVNSLLPWPGEGPEQANPSDIAYNYIAVPGPEAGSGLGMLAMAGMAFWIHARRRKPSKA